MRAGVDMDRLGRWGQITTAMALLTVVAAGTPAVLIDAEGALVAAYVTAGGLGLWTVAGLGMVTAVAAWAIGHGYSDPATAVGATVALAAATLASTLLWAVSVSETLVFSFPASAAWIELHRPVMLTVVGLLTIAAVRVSTLILGTGR
jgi:hypothetical protein